MLQNKTLWHAFCIEPIGAEAQRTLCCLKPRNPEILEDTRHSEVHCTTRVVGSRIEPSIVRATHLHLRIDRPCDPAHLRWQPHAAAEAARLARRSWGLQLAWRSSCGCLLLCADRAPSRCTAATLWRTPGPQVPRRSARGRLLRSSVADRLPRRSPEATLWRTPGPHLPRRSARGRLLRSSVANRLPRCCTAATLWRTSCERGA